MNDKLKQLLRDPYKCTNRKLAYHTRTQEDFNGVAKYFFNLQDSPKNTIGYKMGIEGYNNYISLLKGYKQRFILNYGFDESY